MTCGCGLSLVAAGYDRGRSRVTPFETVERRWGPIGSIDCMGWARKLLRGTTALRPLPPTATGFSQRPAFPEGVRFWTRRFHHPSIGLTVSVRFAFVPTSVRVVSGLSILAAIRRRTRASSSVRSSYLKSGASSESSPICSTRSESSARRRLITRVWPVLLRSGPKGTSRTSSIQISQVLPWTQ